MMKTLVTMAAHYSTLSREGVFDEQGHGGMCRGVCPRNWWCARQAWAKRRFLVLLVGWSARWLPIRLHGHIVCACWSEASLPNGLVFSYNSLSLFISAPIFVCPGRRFSFRLKSRPVSSHPVLFPPTPFHSHLGLFHCPFFISLCPPSATLISAVLPSFLKHPKPNQRQIQVQPLLPQI